MKRHLLAMLVASLLTGCASERPPLAEDRKKAIAKAPQNASQQNTPSKPAKKEPVSHTRKGKGEVPVAIQIALKRLPHISDDQKELFAFLGLKPAREDPLARESVGRVRFFWERWDIGFGDEFVIEISGHWPDYSNPADKSRIYEVSILRKLAEPDPYGRPQYKPMTPAWERKVD